MENEHPIEVELAIRMTRITRRRFQINDARLAELGIGPGQMPVLLDIERLGKCHQRMLAERLQLTPATISAALKRLEKNGLIERSTDESDARASVVTLTKEGAEVCRAARDVLHKTDRDLCADISEEECRGMAALFDKMLKNSETVIEEGKK